EPVVQFPVRDKFQRTNAVCNLFDGVGLSVCKVVHWVNAPLVTRPVMVRMFDAIHDGITHVHVGVRHVYFGAEYFFSVAILTRAHCCKKFEVFLYAPRSIWAFRSLRRGRSLLGSD